LFIEFVLVIVDVYISREGTLIAVQGRVVVSRRDVKLHTAVGSQIFHAFIVLPHPEKLTESSWCYFELCVTT
jgi:hypothetical protein